MKRPVVWWMVAPSLVVAVLLLDRWSKFFFLNNPTTYPVVPGWFWFRFQLNTAMALSLPLLPLLYYSAVGIVLGILVVKAVQLWRHVKLIEFSCVLGIVAGAISNLADRYYYGGVIDFVGGRLGHVFNVADVMIVGGVLLWTIILWKHDRKKTVQTDR